MHTLSPMQMKVIKERIYNVKEKVEVAVIYLQDAKNQDYYQWYESKAIVQAFFKGLAIEKLPLNY